MPKDLTLESLDKSLEQSKSRELERARKIEQESMEEFTKSLRASLQTELSSIEDDTLKRMSNLKKKLTPIREEILLEEQELSKILLANREDLHKSMATLKVRQWLIPTVVGLSIVLGLTIGSYLLGSYVDNELQVLNEVETDMREAKRNRAEIGQNWGKVYNNAIVLKSSMTATVGTTEDGKEAVFFKER